jgi:hypothetical protein
MPIGNPQTIKERVDVLERTLLAINCFSNLCEAAANSGGGAELPTSDVSYLLAYLSESSLYKVEALRVMIDAMPAGAAQMPRARDRRRKSASLAAVA